MKYLFKGGSVFTGSQFEMLDVATDGTKIVAVAPTIDEGQYTVIDISNRLLVPGFVDVHVHLREPGFSHKETIRTGTQAAAAGGYTTVFSMPNLKPVPDNKEHLNMQLSIIERDSVINVFPYAAITKGQQGEELAVCEEISSSVIGFSDDGHGIQSDEMMLTAMQKAKAIGKPIVAHCEIDELATGVCIHNGQWAQQHGYHGIGSESEWRQISRDLDLVRKTGCQYHVCHISAKESVDLIRQAKREGLPVTCETAPHYLVLCDEDLQDDGRFKMNPPIRSKADQHALIEGLLDGTIDCIATDHAPHTDEEKSGGFRGSTIGIVGLETTFPVLYTRLVETGIVPLEVILDRLVTRPRQIFKLPACKIEAETPADLTVLDLKSPSVIDPMHFFSKGHSTPFAGEHVSAAVVMTFCNGKMVFSSTQKQRN